MWFNLSSKHIVITSIFNIFFEHFIFQIPILSEQRKTVNSSFFSILFVFGKRILFKWTVVVLGGAINLITTSSVKWYHLLGYNKIGQTGSTILTDKGLFDKGPSSKYNLLKFKCSVGYRYDANELGKISGEGFP